MKKFIVIFTLNFGLFYHISSQSLVEIKDTEVSISTIGEKTIRILLLFGLPEGFEHSIAAFGRINEEKINIHLVLRSNKEFLINTFDAVVTPSAKGIGFRVMVDEEVIKSLFSGDYDYYFESQHDLYVLTRSVNNPNDTTRLKITKNQIIENTKNKLTLKDEDKNELIESLKGNVERIENTLDFGIIPKQESDTEKMEYYASFSYQKGYSFFKESPIFLSAKGLISTNSSDSLNYLSIYPVSYRLAQHDKSGKPRNYELVAQLGVDANQNFSNYRIAANAYWHGLIPNLIDLSMGENRLRLKPVLKAGVKFYKEYENNRIIETNNQDGNQIFGELYYYIPIKKIYSLILDANVFYDFSKTLNPNEEIMYNVTATLGIDIPKTPFKTIFKYVEGENGITYQKDQLLMIGLMADLFNMK